MLVLGVESSCDETAAAVVEDGRRVLSNIVTAQHDLHRPFGGVIPELAARAHAERVTAVMAEALTEAQCGLDDIEGLAVAHRPGLVGALLVGLSAVKALAWCRRKPFVGVDHLQAHVYAAYLAGWRTYPHLALLVSGGHTALYRVQSPLEMDVLGMTVDDAAGEAFDKAAKLLSLGFPGGPALAKCAESGNPHAVDFPRSAPKSGGFNFSFSGLKTALYYHLRGTTRGRGPLREIGENERADIAASFQEAVCEILTERTLAACVAGASQAVSVVGGVACNRRLRSMFQARGQAVGVEVFFPPPQFCGDNAAMAAGLGWVRLQNGQRDELSLDADPTPRRAARRPASQ
jgi:N6-L-threonylcarbamoyladenine synthase